MFMEPYKAKQMPLEYKIDKEVPIINIKERTFKINIKR